MPHPFRLRIDTQGGEWRAGGKEAKASVRVSSWLSLNLVLQRACLQPETSDGDKWSSEEEKPAHSFIHQHGNGQKWAEPNEVENNGQKTIGLVFRRIRPKSFQN